MKLDQKGASETVREWAELSVFQERFEEGTWWCLMHPQVTRNQESRCPKCEMSLVQAIPGTWREPPDELRRAQLIALEALAERDDGIVPEIARKILVSSADASVRLKAALYWGRVEPEEAAPHVRLFLLTSGPERVAALHEVAEQLPGVFAADLQRIHANEQASDKLRLVAAGGRLKSGHQESLPFIRKFLSSPQALNNPAASDGLPERAVAMYLLGEYGTPEDIQLLTRYLETELQVFAAESLLRLIERDKDG